MQKTFLRYVPKIPSSRFRQAKWNLNMNIDELIRAHLLVTIGNSQVLDHLEQLRGVQFGESVDELKSRIKTLTRQPLDVQTNRKIKQLRARIRNMAFCKDYLLVVMENKSDFKYLCDKGVVFNGISWKFFIGTTGGVKESVMTFVPADIFDELVEWVDCGRNTSLCYIPAKLEAYMSLVCSASTAVSPPNGVLVVHDCVTHFTEDVIKIRDADDGGEPVLEYVPNAEVELIDSDGYGLMLPQLARRWASELGEGEIISGANTRCAYEKGMLFTFDFRRFAHEVAHKTIVQDAWGHDVDIDNVEVILTTSMLKLWDAYDSWDDYWSNCVKNKYSFRVTKVCPQVLENERTTNYQFIQPYELTDDQMRRLVSPTIQNMKEVLSGDWAKTLLYVRGTNMTEKGWSRMSDTWQTAIAVEPSILNDSFIAGHIRQMIKVRIDAAKVGTLDVRGNYAIISGDPYSLCQHVFGLPITGLLRAGECYHKHWADQGVDRVACFRAPMSVGNNIRVLNVSSTDAQRDWYQYMTTCMILNSWDATCHALNGADKDSDTVFTTDNALLVDCAPNKPAILCEQKKGIKKQVAWSDFVTSNIAAAGNDIGAITNRVTAMYDVMTTLDDNELKRELQYRIQCGQHFQQAAIDKIKGIISEPMPKYWYEYRTLKLDPDDDDAIVAWKLHNLKLLAGKKPYFMRYIYDDLMKSWRDFVKNADTHALRAYRMNVHQLRWAVREGLATDDQVEFLRRYDKYVPTSDGKCLVNRICHAIEDEFNIKPIKHDAFDYSIYKTKTSVPASAYKLLQDLYADYTRDVQALALDVSRGKLPDGSFTMYRAILVDYYRGQCEEVVGNSDQLCNILVDICYGGKANKSFVWDMCAEQIVRNLLARNNGRIYAIVKSDDGSVVYHNERFVVKSVAVREETC